MIDIIIILIIITLMFNFGMWYFLYRGILILIRSESERAEVYLEYIRNMKREILSKLSKGVERIGEG